LSTSPPDTLLSSHLFAGVSGNWKYVTLVLLLELYGVVVGDPEIYISHIHYFYDAVAPIVPVEIPLAIDRDYMLTFDMMTSSPRL